MTPRAAIIAGFAAILVLVIATDRYARRDSSGIRPLPATLTAALRSPLARLVLFSAWLWLGWHFLAR
jgi:hypothetical protein